MTRARHVFSTYLTEQEEAQLWRALRADDGWLARRDLALFRLLRHTGIRIGSACALTVDDARQALREGTLQIRDAIAKGGRGYPVPVSRKARAALMALLGLRRERGLPALPEAALLCPRKRAGAGLTPRAVQMRLEYWRRRAGLTVPVTPHWFRHTLAKRMVQRSVAREPLRFVAGALGHRSLDSTAIYTRPDREELAQAMEEAG